MHRQIHPDRTDAEGRRRMRSQLIHGRSHSYHWDYNHHVVPPITASATFRLDSVRRGAQGFEEFASETAVGDDHPPIYIYDRLGEPNGDMLEDNLAAAHGGEVALCFASGMAAISAAICALVRSDEHVVAHKVLYGCTYSLITNWLPRFRIGASLTDLTDLDALRKAIVPATRVVYFESPVNPDMRLIDIAAVRKVVDEVNAHRSAAERVWVVVDNTFATPFCQRPLELGADLVCESLTKAIGGFGTDIGGAVVGPRSKYHDLIMYRKDFGGALSPKSAWPPLVYGLPTLAARMVNYQKSAMQISRFLERHPKVEMVRYPGLESFPQHELAKRQMRDDHGKFAPGSMMYFVVKDEVGSGRAAERLIDWAAENAYTLTLAVSLGQIKTLIEAPYSMTHSAIPDAEKRARGLVPGGIRLSVGLEDWHDIIEDLDAALRQV
ncbi:MAG: aminotransferase class I/II-fold pyridoxal phosphate-dependent enzyme [Planctomycetes bacterium]|nr:aminotransferase class I/II-fold pyridoxal phosphate-dependent enzyme [Planctomycetota bacterium]